MRRSVKEAAAALLLERCEPLLRGPLSEERKEAIAGRIADVWEAIDSSRAPLSCGCAILGPLHDPSLSACAEHAA